MNRKLTVKAMKIKLAIGGAFLFFIFAFVWVQMPSFDTQLITVHYGALQEERAFEIYDPSTINEIKDICKKGQFTNVPKDKMLMGMCTMFIDFHNGTVIGLYADQDYGNLEGKIDPMGRPKYLPEGLNAYISKIISENK